VDPRSRVRVAGVGKRSAWIRSWWFVVLVILLIAVGLAVALMSSGHGILTLSSGCIRRRRASVVARSGPGTGRPVGYEFPHVVT
jgi:hypothetical protein